MPMTHIYAFIIYRPRVLFVFFAPYIDKYRLLQKKTLEYFVAQHLQKSGRKE